MCKQESKQNLNSANFKKKLCETWEGQKIKNKINSRQIETKINSTKIFKTSLTMQKE